MGLFDENELAAELYEGVRGLPIYDYHNHLSPDWLRYGHTFKNPTELWISVDPYKHRLMRICGVPERLITGDASPEEKFTAWCRVFPRLVGTPVYEWCLMELSLLGIDEKPSLVTADVIMEKMSEKLDFSELYSKFGIEKLSPVEPICADIAWYKNRPDVSPSMRGDELLNPTDALLERLAEATGKDTSHFEGFIDAVACRLDEFADVGCRFVDHALDDGFEYIEDESAEKYFASADSLDIYRKKALSSLILKRLATLYAEKGFTMLLHLGAMRKTSSRLRDAVGAAGGYAATGRVDMASIACFLDSVEREGMLPKTVLFPLDPSQTEAVAVLTGSFSRDGTEALVSEGAAWWWCDHTGGIEKVLDSVASYAVIDTFIGMTTDSRSILSFVRHDYFRKTVCRYFAKKLSCGEWSVAPDEVKPILENICCYNAKRLYD